MRPDPIGGPTQESRVVPQTPAQPFGSALDDVESLHADAAQIVGGASAVDDMRRVDQHNYLYSDKKTYSEDDILRYRCSVLNGLTRFIARYQTGLDVSKKSASCSDHKQFLQQSLQLLKVLKQFLIQLKASPISKDSKTLNKIINNIKKNGALYKHIVHDFNEHPVELKNFCAAFKVYVDNILKIDITNESEALKLLQALILFPQDDVQYYCLGGTLTRLLLATNVLDSGPEKLLSNLYSETCFNAKRKIGGAVPDGNDIHTLATLQYYITGDRQEHPIVDRMFRLPLPNIANHIIWEQYVELDEVISHIQTAVKNLSNAISSLIAPTIADQNIYFKPWGLKAWKEDGEVKYKKQKDLECAYFERINQILFQERVDEFVPWQDVHFEKKSSLPSYKAIFTQEGTDWIREQLMLEPQAQQANKTLRPEAALQAVIVCFSDSIMTSYTGNQVMSVMQFYFGFNDFQNILTKVFYEIYLRNSLDNINTENNKITNFIYTMSNFFRMEFPYVLDFNEHESNMEAINFLLGQSCTVNNIDAMLHFNYKNRNSIHYLAEHNFVSQIQYLIHEFERVHQPISAIEIASLFFNRRDSHGVSPIRQAILFGSYDALVFMLSYPVDLSEYDSIHGSLIYSARLCQNENILQLLIEKGASLYPVNPGWNTPVHLAVLQNDPTSLKILIDNGASLDLANQDWNTPVHLAVQQSNPKILKMLIDACASLEVINQDWNTPVHLAVQQSNSEILKMLLDGGASLDEKNKQKQTPVHLAAQQSDLDIFLILIRSGADFF